MVFSLDAESDFFETIAKFRLARKMWAKIAKEKLGAKTQRAMQLKIGIRTSGLSLTHQKPLNNAARVTLHGKDSNWTANPSAIARNGGKR